MSKWNLVNIKGIKVLATSSDAASEIQIAMATCSRKIVSSTFTPKIFGKNTMAVVIVPANTARDTLSTPVITDSSLSLGDLPCFSCSTLSVTTTALSINIPMASKSPIIDRIFKL